MELLDELENLGVDVEAGLDRFMGDEDLYRTALEMFADVAAGTLKIRQENFDSRELDELIGQVHTLKGTAGNLSILPLFTRYTEILALLRDNRPEAAKAIFIETLPIQNNITACICKYQKA